MVVSEAKIRNKPQAAKLHKVHWGALLLVLGAAVLSAQEAESNPFRGDAKAADTGKAFFRQRCSACHGIRAEGGRGPALDRGEFEAGETDLDLYRVIANGVPGTEMPAFGSRNTEESVWRIIAFLRTLEASVDDRIDGNPILGEDIFWNQGACGSCHRVGSRGGRFGPALTRIGRARSTDHLRASLLDPDQDLPPGYYVVEVVTRDGRAIRGIGVGYDGFSAQVRDAAGNLHSFLGEEVRSMSREFASLMPDGYGDSLTDDQQRHLLAYLQSLRGGEEQEP